MPKVFKDAIKTIDNGIKKKSGAKYRNTVFHVHTPESYDFIYDDIEEFATLNERIILNEVLLNYEQGKVDINGEDTNLNQIYNNYEEFGYFLNFATRLFMMNIEIVLVSDHNVLSGNLKLETAVNLISDKSKINGPYIFYGIEISCSDLHHVVVILNRDNYKMIEQTNNWISENINTPETGTHLPSLQVIEDFHSFGAMSYIAHFNSYNTFKKEKFLNKVYREKLFNLEYMNLIGITSQDQENKIRNLLRNNGLKKDFNFVLDEDSHSITDLGKKSFKIKLDRIDYRSLIIALKEYRNCVILDTHRQPNHYIEGITIPPEHKFLNNNYNKSDSINLALSRNMTAIIGGRGSGKSTLLNILDFLCGQNYENENTFKAISEMGQAYCHLNYNEERYLITFEGYAVESPEAILEKETYKSIFAYANNETIDKGKIERVSQLISLWKISSDGLEEMKGNRKKTLLKRLRVRKFSVDRIIEAAKSLEDSNKYITEIMKDNDSLEFPINFSRINNGNDFIEELKIIDKKVEKYNKDMKSFSNDFNIFSKRNNVKLNFELKSWSEIDIDWFKILRIHPAKSSEYVNSYAIKYSNLIEFFYDKSRNSNPFHIIKGTINIELETFKGISEYTEQDSLQITERALTKIDSKTKLKEFMKVIKRLFEISTFELRDFLNNFQLEPGKWGIELDVNKKTGIVSNKSNFRNIVNLSMGQKTVCALMFILTYDEFREINSPLIIDQPEDHLDNQYIYGNLVNTLINLKEKRQIIVASHNSTIVVNSSSELVVVMNSDNNNGWIETCGYSKDRKVIKQIVNILEGGKEAYLSKKDIYSELENL